MAEADLSDQALEAGSVRGRGARAAKIIIDDDDLVAPPAEPAGAIRQTILEARRFPVLLNLAQGRLADVDNRVAIAMAGPDLFPGPVAGRKPPPPGHGRPPRLRGRRARESGR